jgi:antitoxin component of MazEF toxin-antitoxin module
MSRKIFKTGHSLAVTLSKKILQELGLAEGSQVVVELEKDKNQAVIKLDQRHAQLALDLYARHKLGVMPKK